MSGQALPRPNNCPFSVSTPRAVPWSRRPDQAGVVTVVDEPDSVFGDYCLEPCVGQGAKFLLALKVVDRVRPRPKISGMAGHLGDAGSQRSQQRAESVHTDPGPVGPSVYPRTGTPWRAPASRDSRATLRRPWTWWWESMWSGGPPVR